MFPAMPVQANKQERRLVKLFKSLDSSNKETLLSFAEFLHARAQSGSTADDTDKTLDEVITQPLDIKRPEEESVIKAIKRLSATYPMVNKENILHPISGLMTSHMLQGKEAEKVIDELEELFLREYEAATNKNDE